MPVAFITGANGFLGSNLVKKLDGYGWKVIAVSRRKTTIGNIPVMPLDMTNSRAVSKFCSTITCDAVFHLAASIPKVFTNNEIIQCFMPNIMGTLNFLNAAVRMKAKIFTYSSSSSVYGLNCNIITESTPVIPFNFYSTSKFVGDILSEQYRLTKEIKTFTLRISSPYGPDNKKPTVLNRFIESALMNKPLTVFGSGLRKQDFIYIDDIIDAFILTNTNTNRDCEGGVFNIASGNSVTMAQLAKLILSCVPSSRSIIKYIKPPDSQENYQPEYNIAKAKKKLGFIPKVSLREGILKCVSCYQF